MDLRTVRGNFQKYFYVKDKGEVNETDKETELHQNHPVTFAHINHYVYQ